MFKQLRNRFLIVNLVTITVMMLIAFASIYMITYQDVYRDIEMELHKISEPFENPDGAPGRGRLFGDEPLQFEQRGQFGQGMPTGDPGKLPDRSVSFSVQTDAEWNVTQITSRFDMDSEFFEAAVKEALLQGKESGSFGLDGNDWAFTILPASDGYQFVFLDVTAQQAILTNLIYTFLFVAAVMLVVIFFISRYFANRSIAPVKEAFDKQKQFIADASHELKTPLAIIHTNVDVLLSNREDSIQNQVKWLHYIQSEADRMSKLTSDLLYLTEMEDARTRMIFRDFNMSETAENVILTMEAVIFEKNLTLQYEIDPGLHTHGSSEQIQQVIMILLDNAIKYTNDNGSIDIFLKKQHHDIVLSVANTGEGIAPEHLERIFDRFFRTDKSRARKQGGYGLGLAIAKSIIEQHKGTIQAKSTVGEQTVMIVTLPCSS
ncbi:sensor histidine kinase [Marinicrinis lubricantis]|uniref:histidine kinase n=1 Tax=Marinicrinis lubricantis TaxID=2086470 RepID=A0ABW1ISZ3_9BACL